MKITETELQTAIIECARTLGWRVAHFRPAKTERGWRTPVEADGAGFPDLVLVRDGWLIFAELKSKTGKLSVEQTAWMDALTLVSFADDRVLTYVWRPEQWLDGTIEKILRATGAATRRAA